VDGEKGRRTGLKSGDGEEPLLIVIDGEEPLLIVNNC